MAELLSIGEVLMDMTPGQTADGTPCFVPKVGGAPANLACAAARLGIRTAFAGRVGRDSFGRQIRDTLARAGLDTALLQTDEMRCTTLAFVHLNENGDRDFSFYRKGMADVSFAATEEVLAAAARARAVHFGSVALAEEPERSAVLQIVRHAKKSGALISYDPNLRLALWQDEQALRKTVLDTLPLADVLKLSEEEVAFLFGWDDMETALERLCERYGTQAIFLTCGRVGAWGRVNGQTAFAPAYAVNTVDTTGAGDCFFGAALSKLLTDEGWRQMTREGLSALLQYACAAGSLVTTRFGGMEAAPTREEIAACMAGRNTV